MDPIFSSGGGRDVRMVRVAARERADAIRAEELVLVEHDGEHPAKLALVHDGEEAAPADARLARIVEARGELGPRIDEPLELLQHLGVLAEEIRLEGGGGAEGQEADHRPDLEPSRAAVRE